MSDILPPENLDSRLAAIEAGQRAMNTALGLMLDTLQIQMNLLRELMALARDEPEPSKLGQSLGELTFAVMRMGQNVEVVGVTLAALPEQIGAEIDRVLMGSSPSGPPSSGVAP